MNALHYIFFCFSFYLFNYNICSNVLLFQKNMYKFLEENVYVFTKIFNANNVYTKGFFKKKKHMYKNLIYVQNFKR